jgi:hypothetical protein
MASSSSFNPPESESKDTQKLFCAKQISIKALAELRALISYVLKPIQRRTTEVNKAPFVVGFSRPILGAGRDSWKV